MTTILRLADNFGISVKSKMNWKKEIHLATPLRQFFFPAAEIPADLYLL